MKHIGTPLECMKELVGLMDDCDFEMEDYEAMVKYASGPLLEALEIQLMKMDEAAEEKRQMDAADAADAAYEWHMECKGDQMREDNAAFRRGE